MATAAIVIAIASILISALTLTSMWRTHKRIKKLERANNARMPLK